MPFRYTICRLLLLCCYALSAQTAFCRINIAMGATQVQVNSMVVDSTTSLARIRQVTGADWGRFEDWGRLGFWYIYDDAGVAFRWSADSSRLLCIASYHHAVAPPLYQPAHDMTGALSYLGAPLSPTQNIGVLLRRATGHVVSIAPDLYSVCLAQGGYDAQVTWYAASCTPRSVKNAVAFTPSIKQRLESCIIYLTHPTDLMQQKPLSAYILRDTLRINGRPAPDTSYAEVDFVSEADPCLTGIPEVTQMGALEAKFETKNIDTLQLLYDYYKEYLPAHHFQMPYGMEDQYTEEVGQRDINRDGYALLHSGYFGAAVTVFQLNKEFHGDDYNVRDSYAEGLLADRRPMDAMYEYVFALGANPNNDYSSRSTYYYSMRHLALVLGRR